MRPWKLIFRSPLNRNDCRETIAGSDVKFAYGANHGIRETQDKQSHWKLENFIRKFPKEEQSAFIEAYRDALNNL